MAVFASVCACVSVCGCPACGALEYDIRTTVIATKTVITFQIQKIFQFFFLFCDLRHEQKFDAPTGVIMLCDNFCSAMFMGWFFVLDSLKKETYNNVCDFFLLDRVGTII